MQEVGGNQPGSSAICHGVELFFAAMRQFVLRSITIMSISYVRPQKADLQGKK